MKRVLIVEDNKDISSVLEDFLSEHDYEVECVYEGRSASQCLRDNVYDIILMDLMLPHKSGDAIIRELREHSDTPVICLSAKSGMDTRLEVVLRSVQGASDTKAYDGAAYKNIYEGEPL